MNGGHMFKKMRRIAKIKLANSTSSRMLGLEIFWIFSIERSYGQLPGERVVYELEDQRVN